MKKLTKLTLSIFYAICLCIMFMFSAAAYIDPSSMTYLIQIIAGIVIVSGTVIGIVFYRIKRAITRKGKDKDADEEDENAGLDDENLAD